MISWNDMTTWLHGTKEQRLELAKRDSNIQPYNPSQYRCSWNSFMCNICRVTFKNSRPYAIDDTGYDARYFCQSCTVLIGKIW